MRFLPCLTLIFLFGFLALLFYQHAAAMEKTSGTKPRGDKASSRERRTSEGIAIAERLRVEAERRRAELHLAVPSINQKTAASARLGYCEPRKGKLPVEHCDKATLKFKDKFACLGFLFGVHHNLNSETDYWDKRVKLMLTEMKFPVLHGGVTPKKLYDCSRCILALAGVSESQRDLSIGEIGTGVGSLLFMLCPPREGLSCVGVDPTRSLIEVARQRFPHLTTSVGISLTSITHQRFDIVIFVAVTMYQSVDQFCQSMEDALFSTKPGGMVQVWGLSDERIGPWELKWGRSRLHSNVFDHERPLWICPGLAAYIQSVRAITADTPNRPTECPSRKIMYMEWHEYVGTVVRNTAPAPCKYVKTPVDPPIVTKVRTMPNMTEAEYRSFLKEIIQGENFIGKRRPRH